MKYFNVICDYNMVIENAKFLKNKTYKAYKDSSNKYFVIGENNKEQEFSVTEFNVFFTFEIK